MGNEEVEVVEPASRQPGQEYPRRFKWEYWLLFFFASVLFGIGLVMGFVILYVTCCHGFVVAWQYWFFFGSCIAGGTALNCLALRWHLRFEKNYYGRFVKVAVGTLLLLASISASLLIYYSLGAGLEESQESRSRTPDKAVVVRLKAPKVPAVSLWFLSSFCVGAAVTIRYFSLHTLMDSFDALLYDSYADSQEMRNEILRIGGVAQVKRMLRAPSMCREMELAPRKNPDLGLQYMVCELRIWWPLFSDLDRELARNFVADLTSVWSYKSNRLPWARKRFGAKTFWVKVRRLKGKSKKS